MNKRATLTLGLVLMLVGVSLMGWLAWQYFGTNVVAKKHQEQALSQLDRAWEKASPSSEESSGEQAKVSLPTVRDETGGPAQLTAALRIPRFGSEWRQPIIEGTSESVLASGVGKFVSAVGPGDEGNYALIAHRVTHGEPFRNFPSLQRGDLVYVDTQDTIYTYELVQTGLTVDFTQTWILGSTPNESGVKFKPGDRVLTLTTCAELFHTDNRSVAFGLLKSVDPR